MNRRSGLASLSAIRVLTRDRDRPVSESKKGVTILFIRTWDRKRKTWVNRFEVYGGMPNDIKRAVRISA